MSLHFLLWQWYVKREKWPAESKEIGEFGLNNDLVKEMNLVFITDFCKSRDKRKNNMKSFYNSR